MRFNRDQISSAGFTLIELMIAMAITGIITAAMYSVFQAQVRGQVSQDVSLKMTQSLRAAVEILAADIRMAGCDPTDSADAQIHVADDGELILSIDRIGGANGEPDGDCCDGNEQVRYHLTNDADDDGINDNIAPGVACNLGREIGPGLVAAFGCAGATNGLQPLALDVDTLNFVYLDRQGNPLGTPVANTDDISAIQVSIVIRSAETNPGFLKDNTDTTPYDNLQGVEILPAQNDTFRRFQLSTTIDCRNL